MNAKQNLKTFSSKNKCQRKERLLYVNTLKTWKNYFDDV